MFLGIMERIVRIWQGCMFVIDMCMLDGWRSSFLEMYVKYKLNYVVLMFIRKYLQQIELLYLLLGFWIGYVNRINKKILGWF